MSAPSIGIHWASTPRPRARRSAYIGRVRIGPGVSRAVHDQQPTGVRDQVGVVAQPPWCQRDHRADVAARRQVGGHSPAHRVTDYHDLGGVEVLAHGGEGDRRISQRVPLGAVPAARLGGSRLSCRSPWATCPMWKWVARAGRRTHDGEPFIGATARTARRDRTRNRVRTAVDGDCSTALRSRAVPPRAAADPRARAPRPAARRPAARPRSVRSAG